MHDNDSLASLFFHYARRGPFRTRYALLSDILEDAYASDDRLDPDDPAFDALIALAVRELTGGTIERTEIPGYGGHHVNVLPNGEGIALYDLCRPRLPAGTRAPGRGRPVDADALKAANAAAFTALSAALKDVLSRPEPGT